MSAHDGSVNAAGGNGARAEHGYVSKLSWALRSEPGPVRTENEDYADVSVPSIPDDAWDRGPLFLVADGMGGHAAGEVASRVAVEAALAAWVGGSPGAAPQALRNAVRVANTAVYDAALEPGRRGMGTTLVALTLAGHETIIGHVGDSRVYLVRGQTCTQLTADHSKVGEMLRMRLVTPEEAARHPARSQLTRSLGAELGVQVDLTRHPIERGDSLVICTDGFWDLVSRSEMVEAAAGSRDGQAPTPVQMVDDLVGRAIGRGASDNVTAAIVTVTSTLPIPAASGRRLFRRGRA